MPNNDYVIYTDKISRYISTSQSHRAKSLEISLKSDDDTSIFNDIEQVNKDQDIVNDRENKILQISWKIKILKLKRLMRIQIILI